MRNPLLVPDLRELIAAGEADSVRDFFAEYHPASVAEIVKDLGPIEGRAILDLLDPRPRAEVIGYLEPEDQVRIVEAMSPPDAAATLHVMSHDERADLVQRLDDDVVDEILRRLAHAEREDIRRLASYEPGTAGAVMTTDYAALPPHLTVREALDQLRREAPDRETIYYSYVIDDYRRLLGLVSLKTLLLARPRARLDEVMTVDLIVARLDEDQEEVAHKIQEYDLLAIPVTDLEGRLVGIVTHDDAADILREEQAEDFLRFGGVAADASSDEPPSAVGQIVDAVRRRIGWLLFLFVGGAITSTVVRMFGWVDVEFPAIEFGAFIPLLIGTGGNAGSQAVGTIIRGLAIGEIEPSDAPKVILREATTGLVLGTLLGTLAFAFTYLFYDYGAGFALVIALAILGICIWANTVGALVPIVAVRLKIDPAVVSAPLISTLVDATGLIIFYSVAIVVLMHLFPPV